jgi:hypothetical protein
MALVDGHQLLRQCGYKEGSIASIWTRLAGPRHRHVPLSEAQGHLEVLAAQRAGSKHIAEKRRALLHELFGGEEPPPATPPATGAVVPELVELPGGLAELLGKTDLPRVRKVPGELKYSLVDIGHVVTGKDHNKTARDLAAVQDLYPSITHKLSGACFQIQGQRAYDVKVGDMAAVVEYIMLLPGKTAAFLAKAASIVESEWALGPRRPVVPELVELPGGLAELPDGTLAFPDERVRRPPPVPKAAPSTATVALELCSLLGVDQVVKIRTVGEGREKKFSLVDVACLMSGKTSFHAHEDVKAVLQSYKESIDGADTFKFPGRGQQETPVADLRTTLLVVLRLRSRVAQRLSAKVVDVFVRYVGGDLELARETLANREYQEHLALEQPYHPARAFGENVEDAGAREHEPPIVLELFDEAPLLLGAQHLYAMQCVERKSLWKIGVSADPHRRLEQVKTKNGNLNLELRAVWRHEATLEAAVLRALDVPPEDEELKELLKSTEFRWTHQDLHRGVKRAVDFARENARLREFLSRTAEVEEPDLKRRRVSLDLDERELCLQKEKLSIEKEKLGMEKEKLGMEKEKLGIEKEKLELEKTRWLFEQQKKAAQLGDVSR